VSTVPPIRREIVVDADPDAAFEVFTAGIGQWWPLEEKSVHGHGCPEAGGWARQRGSRPRMTPAWPAVSSPSPSAPGRS
jgi:hypothetical protein